MQTHTQGLESADPKSSLSCSTLTRQHRKVTWPLPSSFSIDTNRGRAHIWHPSWCLLDRQGEQLCLSVLTVGHSGPDAWCPLSYLILSTASWWNRSSIHPILQRKRLRCREPASDVWRKEKRALCECFICPLCPNRSLKSLSLPLSSYSCYPCRRLPPPLATSRPLPVSTFPPFQKRTKGAECGPQLVLGSAQLRHSPAVWCWASRVSFSSSAKWGW